MINKFLIRSLNNSEFHQFIISACVLFDKYKLDFERLAPLYEELAQLEKQMEIALTAEKRNEKIREKNEMDRLRDMLHSRMFNYLKYILYDQRDERYDDAQVVMQTLKAVGNPTRLSENLQSNMMIQIGNRLEPLRDKIQAIGALEMLDEMLEANKRFIDLEREAREITAAQKLEDAQSATKVRKSADETYRTIVDALNAFAKMNHKKEIYNELSVEMNVLIDRFNTMIAAKKRRREVIS